MGIRPAEFWRQTPRETWDIIRILSKKEIEAEKEEWKRFRWLICWIINMSQKYVKRDIRPKDILTFPEEIPPPVLPEERERMTKEHLRFMKSKFWTLFEADKDGNVKIFDEEDYKRIMAKKGNN